jgi:hypothetical protein
MGISTPLFNTTFFIVSVPRKSYAPPTGSPYFLQTPFHFADVGFLCPNDLLSILGALTYKAV